MTRSQRFRLVTDVATSRRLSRVRQHGTAPELAVRQALRALGIRYRLQNRDLPGTPDLANRRARWAIFVHGCFWHHHEGCKLATIPKRNRVFWVEKFRSNRLRDERTEKELVASGFRVIVVWQCEAARGKANFKTRFSGLKG